MDSHTIALSAVMTWETVIHSMEYIPGVKLLNPQPQPSTSTLNQGILEMIFVMAGNTILKNVVMMVETAPISN